MRGSANVRNFAWAILGSAYAGARAPQWPYRILTWCQILRMISACVREMNSLDATCLHV